ncbi:MAG: heavy-metal-associated domain-containing protein [Halobellus sp.]|uniref:heavy-metal-associated domain-containing protein n=1 Tax=Halobellus sp. TaxID=1979212 RepID=UPI0035D4BF50
MTYAIAVKGTSCGHCEQTIEGVLESVAGVESATADRDTETAAIEGAAATDELLAALVLLVEA